MEGIATPCHHHFDQPAYIHVCSKGQKILNWSQFGERITDQSNLRLKMSCWCWWFSLLLFIFFVFVLYTVVRAKSSPIFIDLINVRLGLYSILMRKTNHYYLPRTDSREKSREYNCNFFSARSFRPCTSRRCQQSSMITKTIDTLDERHNGDKP